MWVVVCTDLDRTLFADSEWDETHYLQQADRFASRRDAAMCAASMKAAHGGRWIIVKFKEASSL